jgi:hypothetical protein
VASLKIAFVVGSNSWFVTIQVCLRLCLEVFGDILTGRSWSEEAIKEAVQNCSGRF